jgi:putative oxidoreductase
MPRKAEVATGTADGGHSRSTKNTARKQGLPEARYNPLSRMNKLAWALQILLAAVFFVSGNLKLGSFADSSGQPAEWPYPEWLLYVVALVELAGAVGLLVRRTVLMAAWALSLLMIGAIYAGLAEGDGLILIVPHLILILLIWLIFLIGRSEAPNPA